MPRLSKKELLRRARLWQRSKYVKPYVCKKGHGKLIPALSESSGGIDLLCSRDGCDTREHLPTFATPLRIDLRGHGQRIKRLKALQQRALDLRRLLVRVEEAEERLSRCVWDVYRVLPPLPVVQRILRKIERGLNANVQNKGQP